MACRFIMFGKESTVVIFRYKVVLTKKNLRDYKINCKNR